MKVLVLSAMEIEAKSFEDALKDTGFERTKGGVYKKGEIEVYSHLVGIGKVASAVSTAFGVVTVKPDLVISQGCCAGVQNLDVGDVFFIDVAYQYDFDLRPLGYELGEIPGVNIRGFTSCLFDADKDNSQVDTVMLTADKFCTNISSLEIPIDPNQVVGADMETAAIFQACKIMDIKVMGIRGVSDVIGGEAQAEQYEDNVEIACKTVAKVLAEWLCANCIKITENFVQLD